jgi:hypothetical protein
MPPNLAATEETVTFTMLEQTSAFQGDHCLRAMFILVLECWSVLFKKYSFRIETSLQTLSVHLSAYTIRAHSIKSH